MRTSQLFQVKLLMHASRILVKLGRGIDALQFQWKSETSKIALDVKKETHYNFMMFSSEVDLKKSTLLTKLQRTFNIKEDFHKNCFFTARKFQVITKMFSYLKCWHQENSDLTDEYQISFLELVAKGNFHYIDLSLSSNTLGEYHHRGMKFLKSHFHNINVIAFKYIFMVIVCWNRYYKEYYVFIDITPHSTRLNPLKMERGLLRPSDFKKCADNFTNYAQKCVTRSDVARIFRVGPVQNKKGGGGGSWKV